MKKLKEIMKEKFFDLLELGLSYKEAKIALIGIARKVANDTIKEEKSKERDLLKEEERREKAAIVQDLKRRRKVLDLTQKKAADLAGTSQNCVWRAENGQNMTVAMKLHELYRAMESSR